MACWGTQSDDEALQSIVTLTFADKAKEHISDVTATMSLVLRLSIGRNCLELKVGCLEYCKIRVYMINIFYHLDLKLS